MKKRKHVKNIITYVGIILVCIFCLFPVIWMISCSFRPTGEIYSYSVTLLPQNFTVDGYIGLFTRKTSTVDFWAWTRNSLIVATASSLFGLAVALLGAYSLSRYKYHGRMTIAYTILVAQVIPGTLLLIPMYLFMNRTGFIDTFFGLTILNVSFSVPYCTWMMKGYFDGIPYSLNESASIDGATEFQSFIYIIMPLARPGIAVTGFFSFVNSWNEYLFASTLMKSYDKWTLPVGLSSFKGQYTVDYTTMMAGGSFITIPIIILFLLLQRHLVSGMTAGAVKQ